MKNGCCTENVQQPFLWIIQLSHPTRSGRVRVSSEQWGSAGPVSYTHLTLPTT